MNTAGGKGYWRGTSFCGGDPNPTEPLPPLGILRSIPLTNSEILLSRGKAFGKVSQAFLLPSPHLTFPSTCWRVPRPGTEVFRSPSPLRVSPRLSPCPLLPAEEWPSFPVWLCGSCTAQKCLAVGGGSRLKASSLSAHSPKPSSPASKPSRDSHEGVVQASCHSGGRDKEGGRGCEPS